MLRSYHRLLCVDVGRVDLELPGIDNYTTARPYVHEGIVVFIHWSLPVTSPELTDAGG